MYCIKTVPIANSIGEKPKNNDAKVANELEKRRNNVSVQIESAHLLATKWLSPSLSAANNSLTNLMPHQPEHDQQQNSSSILYDVIGRQLAKYAKMPMPEEREQSPDDIGSESVQSPEAKADQTVFKKLEAAMRKIDAHLFSNLLTSCLADAPDEQCRRCSRRGDADHVTLLFITHTVAFEGSRRYYSGIIDFICSDCAIDICEKGSGRDAACNGSFSKRWAQSLKSLRELLSDVDGTPRATLAQMYSLFYLVSGRRGFAITDFDCSVSQFVQERFTATIIKSLVKSPFETVPAAAAKSELANGGGNFLHCVVCSAPAVVGGDFSLGILSTIYYDTSKVFTVPYYVCGPKCRSVWQDSALEKKRHARMLQVHRHSMRHYYGTLLEQYTDLTQRLMGLTTDDVKVTLVPDDMQRHKAGREPFEHIEHPYLALSGNGQEDSDRGFGELRQDSAHKTLLTTIESDTLNALFGLMRHAEQSDEICTRVSLLHEELHIWQCVRKCLCSACTKRNLRYLNLLDHYDATQRIAARMTDSCDPKEYADALCAAEGALQSFIVGSRIAPTVRQRSPHCKPISDSVSPSVQADQLYFSHWRLKSRPFPRGSQPHCASDYSCKETRPANVTLSSFLLETAHFCSPMF